VKSEKLSGGLSEYRGGLSEKRGGFWKNRGGFCTKPTTSLITLHSFSGAPGVSKNTPARTRARKICVQFVPIFVQSLKHAPSSAGFVIRVIIKPVAFEKQAPNALTA